ncbi:DUF2653 family protein [Bacillus mexicanus]|uniref:DUF2653 family protein n=1 Tax=Bacillus mexicanus TaxID=2834415 RepID=UPI003D24C4A8
MQIFFSEQDVIDSIAVYVAHNENKVHRSEVEVKLNTEDFKNFYAIIEFNGVEKELSEEDMIDAIIQYLENDHNFEPGRLKGKIYFEKDEGIIADVIVQGNISLNK